MRIKLRQRWPHQQQILASPVKNKLLVTGRRSGKTEAAVQHLILKSLQRPGEYWWVGPDYLQTRVAERILEDYLWSIAPFHRSTRQFRMPNGPTISIRTASRDKGMRGEGLCGLVLDEAAFVDERVFFEALLPSLKDKQGWMFLASTPWGYNWYHKYYLEVKSRPDWQVLMCPSWASPLMKREVLELERPEMGDARWRQEYGGEFVQKAAAIFDQDWLRPEDLLIKEFPHKNFDRSAISVDMSLGNLSSDFQALCFLGYRGGICYADVLADRMNMEDILDQLAWMWKLYSPETVVFEINSWLQLMAERFQEKFPLIPVHHVESKVKKETRISRLGSMLRQKQLRIKDNHGGQLLIQQLADFPAGEFDDCPDSLEMAWHYLCST